MIVVSVGKALRMMDIDNASMHVVGQCWGAILAGLPIQLDARGKSSIVANGFQLVVEDHDFHVH